MMRDEDAVKVHVIQDDTKATATEEVEPEHIIATSFILPVVGANENPEQESPAQILQLDPLRKVAYVTFNGGGQVYLAHSEAQANALQSGVQQSSDSGTLFTCPAIVKVEGTGPLWAVSSNPENPVQYSLINQSSAAGANFTYTNNTGSPQQIVSYYANFNTDITAANRFPGWEITYPGGQFLATGRDLTAVVASSTLNMTGFIGATPNNAATGSQTLALPNNLFIPPGGTFQLVGVAGASGDQFVNVNLTFNDQTDTSNTPQVVGVLSARRGA